MIRDDAGHPFAMLELSPAGCAPGADAIVVVAKRQRDQYGRVGLSDAERRRIRMMSEEEWERECARV